VESFAERGGQRLSRDMAAWLARRYTRATMREMIPHFGLRHPDSVRNLVRRAESALSKSDDTRQGLEALRTRLLSQSTNVGLRPRLSNRRRKNGSDPKRSFRTNWHGLVSWVT
jgi:hypothetical protein